MIFFAGENRGVTFMLIRSPFDFFRRRKSRGDVLDCRGDESPRNDERGKARNDEWRGKRSRGAQNLTKLKHKMGRINLIFTFL